MKTVHLLYEGDGECYNIIGVFTSKDLADTIVTALRARDKVRYPGGGGSHKYVEEIELDADIMV